MPQNVPAITCGDGCQVGPAYGTHEAYQDRPDMAAGEDRHGTSFSAPKQRKPHIFRVNNYAISVC